MRPQHRRKFRDAFEVFFSERSLERPKTVLHRRVKVTFPAVRLLLHGCRELCTGTVQTNTGKTEGT